MKVLANDGLAKEGIDALRNAGFEVITDKVDQSNLVEFINDQSVAALLVRSATTVRKDLIDACPGLKVIGRGGVGMDNIDVEYARGIGRHVVNTPAASSQSVAELVIGHFFSLSRMLYDANRYMPEADGSGFKSLKKKYGKGIEMRGKTIGIMGFGRIGQSVAQYALGCGMKVVASDMFLKEANIPVVINGDQKVSVSITCVSQEELLAQADMISLHVPMPADKSPVLGATEFAQMKDGVLIVNAARGGVIDEDALIAALDSGKVAHAALDVFVGEPEPRQDILQHPQIALTPHIGGSTQEAQGRIGTELADKLIEILKS